MDNFLTCELRYEADPNRDSPGRLTGTLLRYLEPAHDRPEVFERGALYWNDDLILNIQHDRAQPIMRFTPYLEGDDVKVDAMLPDRTIGRDVASAVKDGTLRGLSVEIDRASVQSQMVNGVRRISRARLVAAGVVDSGSYKNSTVSVRQRQQQDADLLLRRRAAQWL